MYDSLSLFIVLLAEIFLLQAWNLLFLLFAVSDVLFGRVISDKLVAIVFPALKLKIFIAFLIQILIIEIVIIVFVIECLIIVLNFDFDLITQN